MSVSVFQCLEVCTWVHAVQYYLSYYNALGAFWSVSYSESVLLLRKSFRALERSHGLCGSGRKACFGQFTGFWVLALPPVTGSSGGGQHVLRDYILNVCCGSQDRFGCYFPGVRRSGCSATRFMQCLLQSADVITHGAEGVVPTQPAVHRNFSVDHGRL